MIPVTSQFEGVIVSVTERSAGTELAAAASATDDSIEVIDLDGLDRDGGVLTIGEEQIIYTVPEDSEGTVDLDTPLANSYDEEEPVLVYPPAMERLAYVMGDDQEEEIEVRVPHALYDRIAVGIRDDDETSEVVVVAIEDDDFVVVDLLGVEPVIDATFIDRDTTPGGTISDGIPPASSPTPTVQGGISYLAVKWEEEENHDRVTYDVHISDTTGFTPDASTFAGSIVGTLFFARKLPDDSPFVYGTTYYVKLIARDVDGEAGPGGQGSGQLVEALGPDIAVNAIIAEHILAGEVTAEKLEAILVLATRLATGTSGQRVEIDEDGIRLLNASDETMVDIPVVGDPFFAGELFAAGLVLEGHTAPNPPDDRVVKWVDSADEDELVIAAWENGTARSGQLEVRSDDDADATLLANGGDNTAAVYAVADQPIGVSARAGALAAGNDETIIDSNDESDFVRLSARGSGRMAIPDSSTRGGLPTGALVPFAGRTAPADFLLCDGSAVSRSTYADLFAAIVENLGTATITIASPGVVTRNAHGLVTGDSIYFTTTVNLPTGLSPNVLYYVLAETANTFRLATTRANAYAGTAINTSGTQAGVHTLFFCPYGLGNGSTTFNVPDTRGRAVIGADGAAARITGSGTRPDTLGGGGGFETHQLVTAELPVHSHTIPSSGAVTNSGAAGRTTTAGSGQSTGNAGSDTPHPNMPPYLVVNHLIKT